MKNDDAYNNRDYIRDADAFIARWDEEAQAFRSQEATLGRARLNEPYGEAERERLDLFHPGGRAEGLVVWIHGGYWLRFDRSYWSHFAQGALARGWAVAMPSYPLAPAARIADITRSAAAAITRAAELVEGPITVSGHSAGGHLSARMACADALLPPEVRHRITAIVPISPVADLRPLIETSMNADFRLDDTTARAESPTLLERTLPAPVHTFVGGDERPAFLDQARALALAWPETDLTVVKGRHHFNVIDDLLEADSALTQAITPAPSLV